jgi:hypothetical protein
MHEVEHVSADAAIDPRDFQKAYASSRCLSSTCAKRTFCSPGFARPERWPSSAHAEGPFTGREVRTRADRKQVSTPGRAPSQVQMRVHA